MSQIPGSDKECKFCSYEKMTELNIDVCDQGGFQIYCEYFHQHEEQPSKDDFEELYKGEFKSEGDFCESLFSQTDDSYNNLTEALKKHIDWEKIWDYTVKYDYVFEQGHAFRGN